MFVFFKIVVLYVHRIEFFALVRYTQKNFWHSNYDPREKVILADCKRVCAIFIVVISFCTQGTCAGYVMTPLLLANVGKNHLDRVLPFNMWVKFPVGISPYYEISFLIQVVLVVLCMYHVAVGHICFDNFLGIVNLHVTCQFRILQYRLLSLGNVIETQTDEESLSRYTNVYLAKLKGCIQQHQALTEYCRRLENIFTLIILAQVLMFTQADVPQFRNISFVMNMIGTLCMLFMFTYSCDGLLGQSTNVGRVIFLALWSSMSMNKAGKILRQNILITIMRSNQSCRLTASGYFPISLETYTGVNMRTEQSKDYSIIMISFLTKLVGFWPATNPVEKRWRQFAFIYTICLLFFGAYLEMVDMYYAYGDFNDFIYLTCNLVTIILVLYKILVLYVNKKQFAELLLYSEKNFWHAKYDSYEKLALAKCRRTCTRLICIFSFFAQGTAVSYTIGPIITNIGRNESDRVLPFNLWVGVPISMTPYYEIAYVIQILTAYPTGVCYFCFDNFLCIMNMHVATQFRILQYRLANMKTSNVEEYPRGEFRSCISCSAEMYYDKFKGYVQQHQNLIAYCDKLEEVFNLIALGQVLLFSMLICLDGYQILMANVGTERRLIFVFHLLTSMAQLLMFTYSCDGLIRESLNVATAAYVSPWIYLPMNKYGKTMRNDLILVIMRSRSPCCLTGRGFFVVSLETYTREQICVRENMCAEEVPRVVIGQTAISWIKNKDISIAISALLMNCVGIWCADNPSEQRFRNATLMYTVCALIFAVWVQAQDFYHSWGDFGVSVS
ncbi:Putative odorant receptor 13a [Dufourea novaeangliae]|uniref:Putative odorant receptor 13a n=1 Tax=Dufourea novaeangliae TaxID=178035 RepID=A0A154PG13_DUFNO|nr:Putative odorant receptor 13a [Dufourea novaeangliae]